MYFDFLVDLARVGHMVCFAVGIGVAAFIEIVILRDMRTTITGPNVVLLIHGHRLIAIAVKGLWITGLSLFVLKVGVAAAPVTAKLVAKFAIVSMLTANMLAIERFALPLVQDSVGKSVADMNTLHLVALGAIGGISASCWVSALMLGGISSLAQQPPTILMALLLPALMAGSSIGAVLAYWAGQPGPRHAWPAE